MHKDERHDRNCICGCVPTTQNRSNGSAMAGRGGNLTVLCQISSEAAVEATLRRGSRQKFLESLKERTELHTSFFLQMTGVVCAY